MAALILDDWQKDILSCKAKCILLCKGRQIGGTTTFAIKCAKRMISQTNCRIVVASLTEDQAELVIMMTLTYLEKYYKKWLKRPYSTNITKKKIVLNNGSQIISRPVGNTGDALRGFTGDVLYLNEVSRMQESIIVSAKPILLTTGGDIWMDSTPFGKQGYFYESWLNKHNRFKVFNYSSEEVIHNRKISSSWTEKQREESIKMLDEEKKDMGTLAYSQEYLGMFMEDLRRFFDDKWISTVCTLPRSLTTSANLTSCFLGVDIGRLGDDPSTFEIINKLHKESLHQVESIITKKQTTDKTFERILELNRTWNFRNEGIGIDAGSGSLGVGILDFLLREPSVSRKVVALNNRQIALDKRGEKKRTLLKEDMYEKMRALGERGFLKLFNEEDVKASLLSIQIEHVMKEGQPTKVKIFGRDSHIVEGLVRATWLANQKNLNTSIDWI